MLLPVPPVFHDQAVLVLLGDGIGALELARVVVGIDVPLAEPEVEIVKMRAGFTWRRRLVGGRLFAASVACKTNRANDGEGGF